MLIRLSNSGSIRCIFISIVTSCLFLQLPAKEWDWQVQDPGVGQFSCLNSLFAEDGHFYATMCRDGTPSMGVFRSSDGNDWQDIAPGARAKKALSLADGRVLLYGFSDHLVIGQDTSWTFKELEPSSGNVMSAAEGNGRIVLGGNSSPSRVALPTWWVSTDDGQSFTSYNTTDFVPPDYFIETGILDLAYGNGIFVAVGLRGEVWTSSDGVDWNSHSLAEVTEDGEIADENLLSVEFHNGEFIASGAHLSLYRSTNGADWEQLHRGGTGERLDTLIIDGEDWYAGGSNGDMIWSDDGGNSWNEYERLDDLSTLVGGKGTFYAAGNITSSGGPVSPERNLDFSFWDELWVQDVAYSEGKWLVIQQGDTYFAIAPENAVLLLDQATTSDGIYYRHPWFGWFASRSGDWAYHFNLGWIHALESTTDTHLIYSTEQGWISTSATIWPYYYNFSSSDWEIHDPSSG